MAMDNTPPRTRLIAFYSVIAVALLASLKPAFDSYYDRMHRRVTEETLAEGGDVNQLQEVRREWDGRLHGGRTPIDEAMRQMGQNGRASFAEVRPQPSTTFDSVRGWNVLAPAAAAPAPAAAPEPAPEPEVIDLDGEEGGAPEEGAEAPPAEEQELAPEEEEEEPPPPPTKAVRVIRAPPPPAPTAPAEESAPADGQ